MEGCLKQVVDGVEMSTLPNLPLDVRQLLRRFVTEVRVLFGASLEGVVLYGSAARGDFLPGRSNVNLLVLLNKHEFGVLQRYGRIHRRFAREKFIVPLLITEQELRDTADLFPLEYLEIKEHHVLLSGRDPFAELRLDQRHLRLQCEQELHGNLLRLRQRFVEGGSRPDAVLILLPLSVASLLPCLRGLLVTLGVAPRAAAEDQIQDVQTKLGVDLAAFLEAVRLKRGLISPGLAEAPRLFERYLAAFQALVERVDQLRAQGRGEQA